MSDSLLKHYLDLDFDRIFGQPKAEPIPPVREHTPCPTATEIAEVVAAHWQISVAEAMCLCVNVFEPGEDEDTFGLD